MFQKGTDRFETRRHFIMIHITLLEGLLKLYTHDLRGNNIQNLLIQAHGGYFGEYSLKGISRRMGGTYRFTVPPWTALFFYAPHEFVLKSNSRKLMEGEYPPLEAKIPGETVVNYNLVHNKTLSPLGDDQVIESLLFGSRLSYDPNFDQHPFRGYDIVTPEPSGPGGINLKKILDLLHRSGHAYPRIHCGFCRSRIGTRGERYRPYYESQPDFDERPTYRP